LEPSGAHPVELHHRRRPSQLSWFVPVPRSGYRTVVKTLPRRRSYDAVVFASVFAATATTTALGRSGLQPREQFGDRLAARRRLLGLGVRVGAAMTGAGGRRHRRLLVQRGRRRWRRRRWRRG